MIFIVVLGILFFWVLGIGVIGPSFLASHNFPFLWSWGRKFPVFTPLKCWGLLKGMRSSPELLLLDATIFSIPVFCFYGVGGENSQFYPTEGLGFV